MKNFVCGHDVRIIFDVSDDDLLIGWNVVCDCVGGSAPMWLSFAFAVFVVVSSLFRGTGGGGLEKRVSFPGEERPTSSQISHVHFSLNFSWKFTCPVE